MTINSKPIIDRYKDKYIWVIEGIYPHYFLSWWTKYALRKLPRFGLILSILHFHVFVLENLFLSPSTLCVPICMCCRGSILIAFEGSPLFHLSLLITWVFLGLFLCVSSLLCFRSVSLPFLYSLDIQSPFFSLSSIHFLGLVPTFSMEHTSTSS